METSISLLGRLASTPTADDWRRLHDLYRPLPRTWMARAGVPASNVDDLVQDVLLVVVREVAGFERRGQGAFWAWLRTILANRMRHYFRGERYRPEPPRPVGRLRAVRQRPVSQALRKAGKARRRG
jgi:RNA polymerase sigma-70 factor (ECF subfamily)